MLDWTSTLDRLNIAVRDTFGESAPVVYTPGWETDPPAEPFDLVAVFNERWQEVRPFGRDDDEVAPPVSTTRPAFWARLADLPVEPAAGDGIAHAGRQWVVVDVRPDGGGGAWLPVAAR